MLSKGHHTPRTIYPPKLPCEVYIICASDHIALDIARRVVEGKVATLYRDPQAILDAWDAYPLGAQRKYKPYCVKIDADGAPLAVWSLL